MLQLSVLSLFSGRKAPFVKRCFLSVLICLCANAGPARAQEEVEPLAAPKPVLAPEEIPTHVEVEPLRIDLGNDGKIETMAMDRHERLILAVSWLGEVDESKLSEQELALLVLDRLDAQAAGKEPPVPTKRLFALKFVDGKGKVVAQWPMDRQEPGMVHATPDGEIYVAGHGSMTRYDETGNELGRFPFDSIEDGRFAEDHASGITVDEDHVFLAFGNGRSLRATESIVRFDRDFSNPVLVVEQQFGCCAHIDLDVRDGELLVAENSRHRVNRFSFDGELIERWGRRDRNSIAGFEACCNPVNFDFAPNGTLYTAESGVGRVKRYSAKGDFLGLVGYVDTTKFDKGSRLAAMSCYIPIEVSKDENRIYVMDVRANFVRVLERKIP